MGFSIFCGKTPKNRHVWKTDVNILACEVTHNVGSWIFSVYWLPWQTVLEFTEKMVLWLSTRKKKRRYWAYTTSLKLHRNCQLSSRPLCFLRWLLDRNGFMDWSTAVWSQGYGRAGHVGSHHLTFQWLQFMPRPTPALHSDTQTVSVPAAVLHSAINILIAVLFRLPGQALYFQKKKEKRETRPQSWPFHLQKHGNHS